ncbi:MAG: hypothetical protein OXB88_10325 [Bacteriovoracales bacterium]|nr:hypothetical protein [Bacteriovoracales bacterium]
MASFVFSLLSVASVLGESIDHSRFVGRMSDRDPKKTLIKIFTENDNVRLLRTGDSVTFQIGEGENPETPSCQGFVRGAEKRYLVLYVPTLAPCFPKDFLLRRGLMMVFHSKILVQRILEASRYRKTLLAQRDDFLTQLGELNRFLWSFDQERVKSIAQLEKEILNLERKKREALELLETRRKESRELRDNLMGKLDQIGRDLDRYKIYPPPPVRPGWKAERDLGRPVGPVRETKLSGAGAVP